MQVLLIADVKKLGKKGELVNVSDGYAKNYLMPQKLAVAATKSVLNEWESKKGSEANRKANEKKAAEELFEAINGKTITKTEKAGEGGKLFGSVTAIEVAQCLKDQLGLDVDKKKLVMPDNVKALGEYAVKLKLYTDITAEIILKVEAQDA